MNLREIEKIVGSLQSHLFRNANSFSVGMLKSHFKGAGLHFKEHQVYNPGDDVRFIDWKLSAKTNTTYIKTFEEERNVEIYVVVDITNTMLFGYNGVSKLQAALELLCLIYLLAEKSKDKVSAIICTDKILRLPLMSGQEGIILLVSQLEKMGVLKSDGTVNLEKRYETEGNEKKKNSMLKDLIARRKEVVYLNDLSEVSDIELLNKLVYRKNLHCFVIQSPLEKNKKQPFSIFGQGKKKRSLVRIESDTNVHVAKGRYKYLSVDERYLEGFIREML